MKASESLGYREFRERVLRWGHGEEEPKEPILLEYRRLRPDKKGSVYTVRQSIKYDPYCQKGIIRRDPNLTVVPLGWSE